MRKTEIRLTVFPGCRLRLRWTRPDGSTDFVQVLERFNEAECLCWRDCGPEESTAPSQCPRHGPPPSVDGDR